MILCLGVRCETEMSPNPTYDLSFDYAQEIPTYDLRLTTYNLRLTTYDLQLTTYNLQLGLNIGFPACRAGI